MAALSTIAFATLAAASAYQGYQSYESAQDAKAAAKQQEAGAKRLAAEEERNKLQAVMRNQKRRGATKEPGMRDDILTSPLGIPGKSAAALFYPTMAQPGAKTLLGQ